MSQDKRSHAAGKVREIHKYNAKERRGEVSQSSGAMDCYVTVQQSGKEVTHPVCSVVTDGAILGINIPTLN